MKQLNRSIFRPVITFNKDAKRRAQELKLQDRYNQEKDDREQAMSDIRESQNRVGRAATYGSSRGNVEDDDDGILSPGTGYRTKVRSEEAQAARKAGRGRFQHEATASDDELEDEIDDNLNEVSDATNRLKNLGLAMGQEIDSQVKRLARIDGKVGTLDNKIYDNTERVCNAPRPFTDIDIPFSIAETYQVENVRWMFVLIRSLACFPS